jgi:uncharacterized protein
MRAIDLLGGTEIVPEEACFDLLRSWNIGRVAVVVDGAPEIFPVNYHMDGDRICFRTNDGRKLHGLRSGEAAFEVDCINLGARVGWSVVVHGEAESIAVADDAVLPDAAQPWTGPKDFEVRIRPRSIAGRQVQALPQPPLRQPLTELAKDEPRANA